MNRDILHEMNEGLLTEEEAQEILDGLLDTPAEPVENQQSDVEKLLGFSRIEWTAYAQGALLHEIAAWRRIGWPTHCEICGGEINVQKFGWFVVDVEGKSRLKHIVCPK